jgi:hypothetical protein
MVTLFFLLIALIVLTPAALRWGVDSSDGAYSPEWERRQALVRLSLNLSHV